jgi:hypothetical protein
MLIIDETAPLPAESGLSEAELRAALRFAHNKLWILLNNKNAVDKHYVRDAQKAFDKIESALGLNAALEQCKTIEEILCFLHAKYSADEISADMLYPALKHACRLAQESKWQDIASAPKDGTFILMGKTVFITGDWYSCVGCYTGVIGNTSYYCFRRQDSMGDFEPTHWQPLPPPPAAKGE